MNSTSASRRPSGPVRSCLSFAKALNAGNLDAAAACFARDACLVTPDATAIHGREQIRPLLAQMIVHRTEIEVELSSTIGAGEVILANQRWRIRSGEQRDRRLEQAADAVLILRHIEGTWKISIAAPWGCRQSYL